MADRTGKLFGCNGWELCLVDTAIGWWWWNARWRWERGYRRHQLLPPSAPSPKDRQRYCDVSGAAGVRGRRQLLTIRRHACCDTHATTRLLVFRLYHKKTICIETPLVNKLTPTRSLRESTCNFVCFITFKNTSDRCLRMGLVLPIRPPL